MSTRHTHTHPAAATTTARRDPRWRERAACRDTDPELFFPAARPGTPAHDRQAAPKKVCRRCPVREACLAEAFVRIPHGVAGGLTELEREQLARSTRGGRKASA